MTELELEVARQRNFNKVSLEVWYRRYAALFGALGWCQRFYDLDWVREHPQQVIASINRAALALKAKGRDPHQILRQKGLL